MDAENFKVAAPVADVPPEQPESEVESTKTTETWPRVLGILGIVFAALGVLYMLSAAIMNFFVWVTPAAREEMQRQLPTLYPTYPLALSGMILVESVLAVILLVGALQILHHSRAGAKTLVGYAWADLLSNVVGGVLLLVVAMKFYSGIMSDPQLAGAIQSVKSDAELARAMAVPVGSWIVLASMFVALLIAISAWPAFLILWFRRANIREAIARWGALVKKPAVTAPLL